MKYLPIAILWLWGITAAYATSTMGTVFATVLSTITTDQAAAGQTADCVTDGETTICYGGVR